jgi:hypothetical protein
MDNPRGATAFRAVAGFWTARLYSLGWEAKMLLKEGISLTYPRVEAQARQREKQKGSQQSIPGS